MKAKSKKNLDSYYWRNREAYLEKMNRKYKEDKKYREAARERAKKRYHEDAEYRRLTIERAKARNKRLKKERSKNKK